MKYLIPLCLASIIAFILSNCTTVPLSGRQQANLGGEKTLEKVAAAQYRQIIAQSRLSDDVTNVQTVRRVSNEIIAAASRYYNQNGMSKQFNRFKWEINLVEDPAVNAFCMPGGKILVYSGILELCENESQLAVVIGHEISHALAFHSREQRSHGIMADIGQVGVQVATVNKSAEIQQVANAGYSVSAQLGFMLPYNRKLEKEADKIGLRLMAMAGYDPNEAVRFWEKNIKQNGDVKTAFFLTHPTHRSRRNDLQKQIPDAISFAKPYLKKSTAEPGNKPGADSVQINQPAVVSSTKAADSKVNKIESMSLLADSRVPDEHYIVVQVKTVVSYAGMQSKFSALESIDKIHIEPTTIDGANYERVLLGYFTDAQKARAALNAVIREGFNDAFLVEYNHGKRGKWLH